MPSQLSTIWISTWPEKQFEQESSELPSSSKRAQLPGKTAAWWSEEIFKVPLILIIFFVSPDDQAR